MLKWYFWIQWVKFKLLKLSLPVSCNILKMWLLEDVNWHVWITFMACVIFLLGSTAKDEGRYAPYLSSKGNSWEWLMASPSESCSRNASPVPGVWADEGVGNLWGVLGPHSGCWRRMFIWRACGSTFPWPASVRRLGLAKKWHTFSLLF